METAKQKIIELFRVPEEKGVGEHRLSRVAEPPVVDACAASEIRDSGRDTDACASKENDS